jgi:hypothetical protein
VVAVTRSRSAQLLLVALVLLGVGWSLAPRSAPPLYDGVGFPDEPYRFVVAPAGATATKPPTIAAGSTTVTGGQAGAIHASSAEQAPQVNVLIPIGRLPAPAGTRRIVIQARPVQPIAPPAGTFLWSNVYAVGATDARVTMTDATPAATLTLRAATPQRPTPMIERYVGGRWTKLKTVPAGNDIYQSVLPGFGRYAVIGTSKLDFSGGGSSTSYTGVIIIVAVVLVVLALIVIAVRRRRRRAT